MSCFYTPVASNGIDSPGSIDGQVPSNHKSCSMGYLPPFAEVETLRHHPLVVENSVRPSK